MLQRRIRQIPIAAGLLTVFIAGCGGNSEADYSATRFSECLTARDLAPQKMDTSPSSERYVGALARVGAEAARQNGALEAFANDAMPGASTLYLLFFNDADRARDGQQRLERVAREEQADDRLVVRGHLLTVGPEQTEAQSRVVDECLKKSESQPVPLARATYLVGEYGLPRPAIPDRPCSANWGTAAPPTCCAV